MNELLEVLSVWWIKVVVDLSIVYFFIRNTKQVYLMIDNFTRYEYYLIVCGVNPNVIQKILDNTTVSNNNPYLLLNNQCR